MKEQKALKVGDFQIVDNGDLGFTIYSGVKEPSVVLVLKAYLNEEDEKALIKWLLQKKEAI